MDEAVRPAPAGIQPGVDHLPMSPLASAQLPPYTEFPQGPVLDTSKSPTPTPSMRSHTMDIDRILSPDEGTLSSTSLLSRADWEAAQALTALTADTTRGTPGLDGKPAQMTSPEQDRESIVSLLSSQHPLIASTINTSVSAYASGKSHYPRFRSGAEFLERNLASPVANTLDTAGRISGVDRSVRWLLQRRISGENDTAYDRGSKRRRLGSEADVERGLAGVTLDSADGDAPPPAYSADRSPEYEERPGSASSQSRHHHEQQQQQQKLALIPGLRQRIVENSAGIGLAMSDEGMKSVKYCLNWLQWANQFLLGRVTLLKDVLEKWDESQRRRLEAPPGASGSQAQAGQLSRTATTAFHRQSPQRQGLPQDEATLIRMIGGLKTECMDTLHKAIDTVSSYASFLDPKTQSFIRGRLHSTALRSHKALQEKENGQGAGEGASASHATAAPGEKRAASPGPDPSPEERKRSEVVTGAHRVVIFANEGLSMMTHVSHVVARTLENAEYWCENLRRKRPSGDPDQPDDPAAASGPDAKDGIMSPELLAALARAASEKEAARDAGDADGRAEDQKMGGV